MTEFFQICDYFEITPSQFFDVSQENSPLLDTTIAALRKLSDEDLRLILATARRLQQDNK